MPSLVKAPFRVTLNGYGIPYIRAGKSNETLLQVNWSPNPDRHYVALAYELCRVMNENRDRLCHAVNGTTPRGSKGGK